MSYLLYYNFMIHSTFLIESQYLYHMGFRENVYVGVVVDDELLLQTNED